MLNKLAFANSLVILTAAIYVLFALIAVVSPSALQFLSTPSSSAPTLPR
jgi:hypothetical protein